MALREDVQKLEPGAFIEFFDVDLSPLGGNIVRLHAGVNEKGKDVTWRGNEYYRFPIEASGFEATTQGAMPRPTLKIANIGKAIDNQAGAIGVLALEWGGLVGCKVTRTVTLVKYIDAVNFKDGNPNADPNQHFPQDIYYIDRKSAETSSFIEFELMGATDIAGIRIPSRQANRTTCPWEYRGEYCGYAGPAVAKLDDSPTNDRTQDKCGHKLSSCKLRFPNQPLPCGIFPGVGNAG